LNKNCMRAKIHQFILAGMFSLTPIVLSNVSLKIFNPALSRMKGKFCNIFKEELAFPISFGSDKMVILDF